MTRTILEELELIENQAHRAAKAVATLITMEDDPRKMTPRMVRYHDIIGALAVIRTAALIGKESIEDD